MKVLISQLVAEIRARVASVIETLSDPSAELRTVFHGPPEEFLRELLKELTPDGVLRVQITDVVSAALPVLLPISEHEDGIANPAVGLSGICDSEYLLSLRNTPACRQFLTLSLPGRTGILSLTQAGDSFGVSTEANSGSASVSDWWNDGFVQKLVERAVTRAGFTDPKEIDSARELLERAVFAADLEDRHSADRALAWRVLSRAFEVDSSPENRASQWSLACGFPPTGDGKLDSELQIKSLKLLLDALAAEGFGPTKLRISAAGSLEEGSAVAECFKHLRSSAEVALSLKQAAPYHYCTIRGTILEAPPEWWTILTAERLIELMEQEGEVTPEGSVSLECANVLFAPGRGLPAIVSAIPVLNATLPADISVAEDFVLRREMPKVAEKREWPLSPANSQAEDDSVPKHSKPIKYTASAAGLKSGSIRLVSLEGWEPGVVVTCRSARKLELPKRLKTGGGADLECSITLEGEGRHFLELFLAPGFSIIGSVVGQDLTVDANSSLEATYVPPASGGVGSAWGIEIVASLDCIFLITLTGADGKAVKLRLTIRCDEADAEACRSQFESLIRLNLENRKGSARPFVNVDRQPRVADLQGWALDEASVRRSFYPLVIAPDSANVWRMPDWSTREGTVISSAKFLHDPRPSQAEMDPPEELLEARAKIAARVRGADGHLLIEEADFGKWASEPDFLEEVDLYVRSYALWLSNEPDIACWADILVVGRVEGDGKTLSQEPDAIIVSPLHPVRLAWHVVAQRALYDAHRAGQPCPAASVLDPSVVPDTIVLPLKGPSGSISRIPFFATECGSDYWAVLWNASRLDRLASHGMHAPFDAEFGLQLGNVSSGFSSSQVKRALDDVSSLLAAKPILNVLVSSGAGHSKSCDDGIIEWTTKRFTHEKTKAARPFAMGPRQLHIIDDRKLAAQPEPATIAGLADDTIGAVKWYAKAHSSVRPDLSIIAQLETTNAGVDENQLRSPLGHGGLIRHRLRNQLRAGKGAFITETRMSQKGPPTADVLADHVADSLSLLENLGPACLGMVFAPSVSVVQQLLEEKGSEYVAVSSSAVDPACFLGGWLPGVYLWDYELPSYSNRAGETSGYYLLSRVREIDCDALESLLTKLPGLGTMARADVQSLLLEVARRGIPTVRGLSAGHSGAAGDLGLFLAGRLLQDEFRENPQGAGLLPIRSSVADRDEVFLVIPVDPFRGHLADLQRSMPNKSFLRPDLIVAGISISDSKVAIRITPVEVKYRTEPMSGSERVDALEQATALGALFETLQKRADEEGSVLWRVAFQHLLLSMFDFGFRVYSQRAALGHDSDTWSRLYSRVLTGIVSNTAAIQVDTRGRLMVFDSSPVSGPSDLDQDKFCETINVSLVDAASIVRGEDDSLVSAIREKLGRWDFSPHHDLLFKPNEKAHSQISKTDQGQGIPVVSVISEANGAMSGEPSAHADESLPTASADPESVDLVQQAVGTGFSESAVTPANPEGMHIIVGDTVDGFKSQQRLLRLSQTQLNNLNMGVVGDLGTGKTQLVKSLVYQIVRSSADNDGVQPRFLILDYKKDYAKEDFVHATGAKVFRPFNLPVNLFDTTGSTHAQPWFARYKFFVDVLGKIYSGIGPVQSERLKEAVKRAYTDAAARQVQPTIYDVFEQYKGVTSTVDSIYAIMSDIVDNGLFAREPSIGAGFASFFDGVVVLSLDELGQDDKTKNMVVAIMLNLFYEHMLTIPKRDFRGHDPQLRTVDSYLLVDEADSIMKYEFDVLSSVLKQGREFGVGVLLATQYLKHFKTGGTDYRDPLLSWFIHKVPNVTAAELVALGMPGASNELAARIQALPNHQHVYKTADIAGEVVRGLPFYEVLSKEP